MEYIELKRLTIFRDLNSDELRKLAEFISVQKNEKGWVLFREGTTGRVLYVVKSGEVDIVKNLGSSNEILLERLKADAVFGEMALVLDAPRSASARVASDSCELISITSAILENILRKEPSIAAKILKVLLAQGLHRVFELDRRLEYLENKLKATKELG